MEEILKTLDPSIAETIREWFRGKDAAQTRPALYRMEVVKPSEYRPFWTVHLWADFAGQLRRASGEGEDVQHAQIAAAIRLEDKYARFLERNPFAKGR